MSEARSEQTTPAEEAQERTEAEVPEEAAAAEEAPAVEPPAGESREKEGEPGDADGEEPESELERALRERGEYLDLAQRARADLDNYRRRVAGEAAGAELRGRSSLARALLPAIDNLERALLAAGVDPDGGPPDDGEPQSQEVSAQTALAEGVALVYRELRGGLQRSGVEAFDPTGEAFDPARHEAVATGQSEGAGKGEVLETLEKGYVVGEQVLRPARVVVNG